MPHYRPTYFNLNLQQAFAAAGAPLPNDTAVVNMSGPGFVSFIQIVTNSGLIPFQVATVEPQTPGGPSGASYLWPASSILPSSLTTPTGANRYTWPVQEVIMAARPDLSAAQTGTNVLTVTSLSGAGLPVDTVVSFFNTVEAGVFVISHTTVGVVAWSSLTLYPNSWFNGTLRISANNYSGLASVPCFMRGLVYLDIPELT